MVEFSPLFSRSAYLRKQPICVSAYLRNTKGCLADLRTCVILRGVWSSRSVSFLFIMADTRNITCNVVSTPSKLVDVVLAPDGSNFGEWKFLVEINLGGMGKDEHLTGTCPTEQARVEEWKRDDKALLSRIINCIDRKIILSMQHCKTVKEVWDLVNKWFSGTDNMRKLYQLSQDVHRPSQNGRDIRDYFYDFKSVSEALCAAMPVTDDVNKMKKTTRSVACV